MPCMVIVLHYTQSLITQKYQSDVHAYTLIKIKIKFKLKNTKENHKLDQIRCLFQHKQLPAM